MDSPKGGAGWIVGMFGIATSLIHALLHAPTSWTDGVPHFTFGLVAWNAALNRGLRHSILLHSVHNLVLLLVSTYFRSH